SDGGVVESKTVALLRARRSRLVSFSGPVCSVATDPTVTVDPAGQVVDLNPANNALAATCPASTPSLYSLKR
ncbi:MAG: CARDB domain-containing protein, partial [Solirubrobacteraceae bacterium]